MTLGDTSNGLMMLRLYRTAEQDPRRKIDYNLLITGVSILSGLLVAAVALATLLTEVIGWHGSAVQALATLDTSHAGYLLAGFFAVVGSAAVLLWRRTAAAPR
jgi:high-affinity nickel-transport protein